MDDPSRRGGLALHGTAPNPSRGDRLDVSFALPDAAPAQLALFDLGGRCVASEEVGARGAGSHVVNLARQVPIVPGIYFIRLTHAGRQVASRVAIVR